MTLYYIVPIVISIRILLFMFENLNLSTSYQMALIDRLLAIITIIINMKYKQ